jgi:NADH/NAD ratio-sensing transcriptional regulator Rex
MDRALDLGLGSAVRTHRIQRDHARHGVFELAGFFNVEDFASLIVAALGASPMRHLFLVAIGALGKAVGFQCVVRAPGGSALLGVSPFRIRHR